MSIDQWVHLGHNRIWAMIAYLAVIIIIVSLRNVWYERRLDNEGFVPVVNPLYALAFSAVILLPPIYLMSIDILTGIIAFGLALLFSLGAADAVGSYFTHKRNMRRGKKINKA